jgi:SAM-dependent methyltransferase
VELLQSDIDYFERGGAENATFWRRLGAKPAFAGRRVLDVGCGLGRLCVDAALDGAAQVVGVDCEARQIEFAREYVQRQYPQVAGRVAFRAGELKDLAGGDFDLILCKDAFEHILDLPQALAAMARRLKPGGRIYAGFGPLYRSPFGHHGRIRTWVPWRNCPWHHLWESEARICARMNRHRAAGGNVFCYSDAPIRSIRDLGLNMHSFADYQRILHGAGLTVTSFLVNRSASPLSKVLSVLRRIPGLTDYCTHNIYCVLEKPGAAAGRE